MLERYQVGGLGGELTGSDGLFTKLYRCHLSVGLSEGPLLHNTVGRPHTAIEEPTTRLFTHVCIKLMVSGLL